MAKLLNTKRHPNSQIRHAILFNSMLRAARTGDAQLLLSEGLYSEEMHCLNRALNPETPSILISTNTECDVPEKSILPNLVGAKHQRHLSR
jgi:hypothetical protein